MDNQNDGSPRAGVYPGAGRSQIFCPPPGGISLDQAMRIFLKWANDHPEQLHESARISVMLSLAQAFPCAR